ncbi:MAG: DUF1194 domain-containing protein, partial [Thermoanaerobaculia bacterium]
MRTRSQAGGNTDLEACIDLATAVIGQQLPVSSKQVIDLSTDGRQREGDAIRGANDAVAAGIDSINAIGVGNGIDVGFLEAMVRPQPAGGQDGFVVVVADFIEYVNAIRDKIRREVSPDLQVTIDDGKETAVPGDNHTYVVTVANNGSGAVTQLDLSEFLPPELLEPSFETSTGSFDSTSGEWTDLLLEGGSAVLLTVSGRIDPAAIGSLESSVTVTPPTGVFDLEPADNTDTDSTLLVPAVDLALSKTHLGGFLAGQTGAYRLDVSSSGPSQSTGPVQVIDELPAELTPLAATGEGWSCTVAGQIVTCSHAGPLLPATSLPAIDLGVAIAPTTPSLVINSAAVTAPEADPLPGNNFASVTTPVEAIPSVAIGNTTVTEGDTGTTQAGLRVILSSPSSLEVALDYATADGTAHAGTDYTASTGIVTFAPGAVE